MNRNDSRELLPKSCLQSFDDIVQGVVLGASNHIKLILHMYEAIAQENEKELAKEKIEILGNYFKETRGKSSYAIVKALQNVENKLKELENESFSNAVKQACNAYFAETDRNIKQILIYAERVLKNCHSVMIYDYSSTVEKAILSKKELLDVYIPESRVIDGGYPFVENIVQAGHHVHFLADAAMLSVLHRIDMVFIGAETFYPDGTAFNTIGSDILGELCKLYKVPYYVITPLLKCDIRALYGVYKETLTTDVTNRFTQDWTTSLKAKVDFESIELVSIRPELISGYITEAGILNVHNIFTVVKGEG